jgi:hypothetical protein
VKWEGKSENARIHSLDAGADLATSLIQEQEK